MTQIANMAENPIRIREHRKAAKMTLEVLAEKIGTSVGYLSDMEKGKRRTNTDWLNKIGAQLGVSPNDLLSGSDENDSVPSRRTVPLVGYVGAGAVAHFYAAGDGELDRVDAPEGATDHTVAGEIRGVSLGPLFERWLLFWDDVRDPVTPDLHGQLCVVGLPDDRILVKQLKPTSLPNHFHLLSNNEEPIFDQEVLWAARVKTMTPR